MQYSDHNSVALKSDFSLIWFLKTCFWRVVSKFFKSDTTVRVSPDFEVVQSLRRSGDVNSFPVLRGKYRNQADERVIKYVHGGPWDIHRLLLRHEAGMLDLLQKVTENEQSCEVNFPKFVRYEEAPRHAYLELSFIPAQKVVANPAMLVRQLVRIISGLQFVGTKMLETGAQMFLPQKGMASIVLCFPCHTIKLFLRGLIPFSFVRLLLAYFYHTLWNAWGSAQYTFSHRDIHSENVIVNGDKLYLIDPAVAVWSFQETDAAIAARNYFGKLGEPGLRSLLRKLQAEHINETWFWLLSVYNTVHYLSYTNPTARYYQSALMYLHYLESNVLQK